MNGKPPTSIASPALSGTMLTGLAASSGIARGAAFVMTSGDSMPVPRRRIASADVATELKRLDLAVAEIERELFRLREENRRKLGDEPAAIFDAQACLLRDPDLCDAVIRRCRDERINAEAAWSDAADALNDRFARIDDPVIRERAADLRDVTRLSRASPHDSHFLTALRRARSPFQRQPLKTSMHELVIPPIALRDVLRHPRPALPSRHD